MMKNVLTLLIFVLISNLKVESQKKTAYQKNDIRVKSLHKAVLYAGSLKRIERFPSKYITPRNVDIWLPENYTKSKKYAVLYMHDGQNLFDSTTTWNKQEWKVDDWVSKLNKQQKIKDVIVVGIHSVSSIRWQDLFPEKAMEYIPQQTRDSIYKQAKATGFNTNLTGDEYLSFLVKELKPFIDKRYATLKDQENTFVAGSSMGGLMSMYAICEYPKIFSGAACISTHWPGATPMKNNPFSKAILTYLKAKIPSKKNHKFYFDYGTKTLDRFYPKYAETIDSIFSEKGYTNQNYKNIRFEGDDHSENSWNKRFHIPLKFLLKH